MTFGVIVLGAFALVFVAFPAALLLADRIDPWVHKQIRRIKRALAARWLAEDGLTVTPLRREEGLKRRVGHDEMMEIIGRI